MAQHWLCHPYIERMNFVVKTAIKVRQTKKRNLIKRYWPLYVLAIPAVVLMIIYRYIPMGGLALAFTDYSAGMKLQNAEFVGIKWFQQIFSNEEFGRVLWNTIYLSLLKLIFSFPAPIILALLLNEMTSTKIRRSVQTVLYLPHFLSWAILAGILFTLLSPQTGILKFFGVQESVFLNSAAFRPLLVITDVWKTCGWGTIVYMAAISSVSPDFYEAAMIDGATRFQRMRYITLPCISSTITVLLILKIGSILDAGFDQVFMLYNPAVYDVADILDTYVYRIGMSQGNFALATAAGLFKSVVGLVLVIVANRLVKLVDKDAGIL